MSEMSGDLTRHVRYPADLFKVQRAMLGRYHVTDRRLVLLARRRVDDAERPDRPAQHARCSRRTT